MENGLKEFSPEKQLEISRLWKAVCVAIVRGEVAHGKGGSERAVHFRNEARDALETSSSSSG